MSRFFSVFLVAILIAKFSYAAGDNLYLVEGVEVSIKGKTATAARAAAIATAQRDAFLILLTRLEIETNIADNISDEEISYMVRSRQIDKEKIGGANYSAVLNVLFAKDFVDHLLSQKNLQKDKNSADQDEFLLLIPSKILKDKRVVLWEEENDWKDALAKAVKKKSAEFGKKKFILPEADIGNIAAMNDKNISSIEYSSLEPVFDKYNASAAYSLIFFYDEIENKAMISLSHISKLQKKRLKLSFVNVDLLGYKELLDKVADRVMDYLINNQSDDKKSTSSEMINCEVPVVNFANWMDVKNKIENSNLVQQLNIESVSKDMVRISIKYDDSQGNLIDTFAKNGLLLIKKSENLYSLSIE